MSDERGVVAPPTPASWSVGSLCVSAGVLGAGWLAQASLGAPDAVGYAALLGAALAPPVAWSLWRVRFEREQVTAFAAACDRVTSREVERIERRLESVDVLARGEQGGSVVRLERRREMRRVVYVIVDDQDPPGSTQNR